MLVSILLCSLPLALPALAGVGYALAALLTISAVDPGYPLGTVESFGSFDVASVQPVRIRLATVAAIPRDEHGRFTSGPRTLPARDSRGRFISNKAPAHPVARPTVL